MELFILIGSQDYKTLYYKDSTVGKKYEGALIGNPLINEWKKQEAVTRVKGKLGKTQVDIMDFDGFVGVVFTSKAKELFQDLILPYCEFLPLELYGKNIYLLNPTSVLDCLDMEKSETEKVPPLNFERIVFKRNINYPLIFRMANDPGNIIVTDKFVTILKENNIEGYDLCKLWDSDENE